ncbi:DUF3857 domain-containing transglutaminase family protein [Flammeovirga kamogawensis]|uniref:DUF3857 domain-containing transglutaminase family protein n=1 Tax=Flammeovirga kamogawensis TaxID=373891 RepID=A0ABX8GQL8_9BACT|nr:DUF3857 domain-containing transglutaminase family protein [Flammeovirga kamogawensis]MBB6463482.1 transglutaminase-like putative cysteine protease [Flammeovirga kamogawensis]QWG05592.1 DUF3857 domain-containing transglutaminase family protein [Flammeovirga kamogawensis]TRX67424.1 DUF3857 domain-containing protein [Flammeovirga kamogawensis]
MRILLFLLLSGVSIQLLAQSKKVTITKTPAWVKQVDFLSQDQDSLVGSFHYLLLSYQENLINDEYYSERAIKILSSDGVQEFSNIQVNFDPQFQKLRIHQVNLIRDGKVINKLSLKDISVYQREENLERNIYDGSLSAVQNLTDVRKGDILHYAYSRKGRNPLYGNNYSRLFFQQYSSPISRMYNLVIAPSSLEISTKTFKGGKDFDKKTIGTTSYYTYDAPALDIVYYEDNVPSWYNDQAYVQFSTFSKWGSIVKWGLPLYKYKDITHLAQKIKIKKNTKSNTLKWIRFVQDEVRYLGMEQGINGYKPHAPAKVLNQRFGDCKDKSLLLIALLKTEGIQAYPVLVHSYNGLNLPNLLPSIHNFNHCVVQIIIDGKTYYVDPTMSNQGGDLEHMYFPNYHYGLVIKNGESALTKLPEPIISEYLLKELITIDSVGGGGNLVLRTEYKGGKADDMRDYFTSTQRNKIERAYEDFYSELYEGVTTSKAIKFIDNNRYSTNTVIIEEYYTVNNFWITLEDTSQIRFSTSPILLESLFNYPSINTRKMPYFLGNKMSYKQVTDVKLPTDWTINDETETINSTAFNYTNELVKVDDENFTITHTYTLLKNFIPAKDAKQVIKKANEINNQIKYMLTYNTSFDKKENKHISLIAVFLGIIIFAIAGYFALQFYNQFQPAPWKYAEDKPISGWLFLPALGLIIKVPAQLFEIIDSNYFYASIWNYGTKISEDISVQLSYYGIVSLEFIYNIFYLTLCILALTVFLKRKTSTRYIVPFLYLVSVVIPVIDNIATTLFLGDYLSVDTTDFYKDTFKSMITFGLWGSYIYFNSNSKSTFCKV